DAAGQQQHGGQPVAERATGADAEGDLVRELEARRVAVAPPAQVGEEESPAAGGGGEHDADARIPLARSAAGFDSDERRLHARIDVDGEERAPAAVELDRGGEQGVGEARSAFGTGA